MKWHVLLHQQSNNTNSCRNNTRLAARTAAPHQSKLDRLPEYFRDTMEWFLGRSRRKPPDGNKENVAASTQRMLKPHGGSVDQCSGRARKSQSVDFSVCDSVSNEQFGQLVALPPGMQLNEWLATHALSFFHHINALYGSVSELCTSDSCPVMCIPGQTLPWVDEKGKKWKYSAPQYVDCVMSFVERTVCSDDGGFPAKYGQPFPADFDSVLRRVCRLLWYVLGHLHWVHWEQVALLGLRPQAAAQLAHFAAFCSHYSLLDAKDFTLLDQLALSCRPPCSISAPTTAEPGPVRMDTSEPLQDSCNRKSGSWGGSQAPPYLSSLQPCAQTA